MQIAALQNISCFSLLASPTQLADLVQTAKKQGYDAVALTDVNVTYGLVDFYELAREAGIKPLLGMQLRMRGLVDASQNYDLVLLAKNEAGYQNLLKLTSKFNLLTDNGDAPDKVSWQELAPYFQHLMVIEPANDKSELKSLFQNQADLGQQFVDKLQALLGADAQLYLGIYAQADQADYIAYCKDLSPIVALEDVRYLRPQDQFLRRTLLAVKNGQVLSDPEVLSKQEGSHWLRPAADLQQRCEQLGCPEAAANTAQIAQECSVQIKLNGPELPVFKQDKFKTSQEALRHLAQAGLADRFAGQTIPQNYQERLDYELGVIHQMGFDDYFLIVWDVMNFAHRQKITTGPGRGSACGSLVSYCMHITEVDPLAYNLLFERFLNPARQQMPDIDLDFPDDRRDEVIQYMFKKYGMDHAAQILTFGTLAAKQALRDVSRAFGLNQVEVGRLSQAVPYSKNKQTLPEAYQRSKKLRLLVNQTPLNKLLFKTACGLENRPRHYSIHAAGLVISDKSIAATVGLQAGPLGIPVTQQTKENVERMGLLKIDFLGLRNLTLLGQALKMANIADPNKIPLDDKSTLALFQRGDTEAIFQFEAPSIRRVLRQLHPDSFEDIVAVNALNRPGPMENIPHFIARKQGKEPITYPDPSLAKILAPTYGILVYQEQVMQTAQVLAGFSLAEADNLRRAMSKKNEEIIAAEKGRFIEGAKKLGHSEQVAEQVYSYIEQFANYGFNRSHAVAYSEVAFWLAYLKTHFPGAFYTALLNSNGADKEKMARYLASMHKAGLRVLHPDINKSGLAFHLQGKQILVGLAAIKGLRRDFSQQIVANQPYRSFSDFLLQSNPKYLSKEAVKNLIKAGCFDSLESNRAELLATADEEIASIKMAGGNQTLFEALLPKQVAVPKLSKSEKAAQEKEVLGFATTMTALEAVRKYATRFNAKSFDEFSVNEKGIAVGQLLRLKKVKTKKGQTMAFASFNDGTSQAELTIFPGTFSYIESQLVLDQIYLLEVQTRTDRYDGERLQFILNKLKRVNFTD
jgi:DNA polymerase-3 subunit alpha